MWTCITINNIKDMRVLIIILINTLNIKHHLEVSWAEAVERTVLTVELLSCVLPQVNIQIGLEEKIKEESR